MSKKINSILVITLISVITSANAQGMFGKLKEKVSQTSGSSAKVSDKPSESELKAAEEDKTDTYLDQKTGTKIDPNKLSGIYYSTKIITGISSSKKTCAIQKFLLNYESDVDGYNYTLNHRFSFEEKNGIKVSPVKLNMEMFAFRVRKKAGIISLQPDYDAQTSNYAFAGNKYTGEINNSGQVECPTAAKTEASRLSTFYFIEDGIIAIVPNKYETRDFQTLDCFVEFQKYYEPVLLYKKEKEERAKQITSTEIHKKLEVYGKIYIETLDKGTVGSELPRPGGASTSPIFGEPKTKIIDAFNKYMAKEGLSQYVPQYAYVHFDYPNYSNLMIPHPATGIQVKNGRMVDFIVVAKNTNKNNSGKNPNLYVEAEYVYFHVNFANYVKNNQYNTENYETTWTITNATSPSAGVVDENENVMKYKGK